jgi:hypothetical protein
MNRSVCSIAAFVTALALPALAQDTRAAAVQLFDAAQSLAQQRRFAEACPKYAESYKLDPQLGALLHLGDCLEQNAQLASAYAAFRDAAEVAQAKDDSRQTVAAERAQKLEPRLSRISIEVAAEARVAGLEVLRDGSLISEATFGMPIAVDGGEHRVEARAPGHRPFQVSVTLQPEGGSEHVVVPALVALPPEQPAPRDTPAPPPKRDPSPLAAESGGAPALFWVAGGIAVVGLGAGVAFNLMGRSAAEKAEQVCINDPSDDVCEVGDEQERSRRESNLDAARTDRLLSYVSFGVGGVAAATALVTLLVSGSSASSASGLTVAPRIGSRAGSLHVQGSF